MRNRTVLIGAFVSIVLASIGGYLDRSLSLLGTASFVILMLAYILTLIKKQPIHVFSVVAVVIVASFMVFTFLISKGSESLRGLDCSPNCTDQSGIDSSVSRTQTALWWGVAGGSLGVVSIVLARKK